LIEFVENVHAPSDVHTNTSVRDMVMVEIEEEGGEEQSHWFIDLESRDLTPLLMYQLPKPQS